MNWIDNLPWSIVILACLTLGLAPFTPPHLWEKLQMLSRGELVRPLGWADLLLHAAPWNRAPSQGESEPRPVSRTVRFRTWIVRLLAALKENNVAVYSIDVAA